MDGEVGSNPGICILYVLIENKSYKMVDFQLSSIE